MFYSFIAGLMILGVIIGMFVLIWKIILYTRDPFEKTVRLLSFAGGVLIFVGSKGMGLSIPELILSSFDSTGHIVSFIASVLPALIGGFLTFYIFKIISINRDKNQLIYFLILLATFIILIFSDLFIYSIFSKESNLGINVSFVIGVILTLLLKIDIFRSIYNFIIDNNFNNNQNTYDDNSSWKDKL